MATLGATSVFTAVGFIDPVASPPVIPVDASLAVGDVLVIAAYTAQALGGGNTLTIDNMFKISIDGANPERLGGIFMAEVSDPSVFTGGGAILRSNATSTRVCVSVAIIIPGTDETISVVSCIGPEWNGSAALSDTFPSVAAGDFNFGFSFTNKSANEILTTHSSVGGGVLVVEANSPGGASGSVSDSVVSIFSGGTGVAFNVSQANSMAYSLSVNATLEPPPPLPEVTGNGFISVEQMLQTPGATFAHRNLGGTYPEMTEYGIRRAANDGYGVIEISSQGASDGWVGAHDETPDRVAIQTTHDGQNFSTLTVAEVVAMDVGVGATGAPQPFADLQTLIQTLPEDFVFMVDPKQQAATRMSEFLTIVDMLLGTERAFIKIDGASAVVRFQEAKAAGFITAAYFYDTTPEAKIIENMPYVDLPGLNWDADQSFWDDLLLYGKPIWGHVAADQTQYDTAINKGATFVQCTNSSITAVGVESWVPVNPIENAEFFETDYLERQYLLATVVGASDSMSLGDLRALSGTIYVPRSFYINELGLVSNASLSRDDARRAFFLQELT